MTLFILYLMDTESKLCDIKYKIFIQLKMTNPEGQALIWNQQPAKNMYPYIKERLDNYNVNWKLSENELNKMYEEQKELYNIYHYENSYLSMTDKRKVRFCLECKIYYRPSKIMKDVNINLCSECFRKLI